MKIGIIKEYKNPPDRRVVFSPSKCVEITKKFSKVKFLVESSDIRCFSDEDYLKNRKLYNWRHYKV